MRRYTFHFSTRWPWLFHWRVEREPFFYTSWHLGICTLLFEVVRSERP